MSYEYVEPANWQAERAVAWMEMDDARESHLPRVADLLERAASLIKGNPLTFSGPWAVHDAINQAWCEMGASEPEVLDDARDWMLRVALDRSGTIPMSLVSLVEWAAECVRDEAREEA
jgi:hypothetical protein